jgi:hypothetical protein
MGARSALDRMALDVANGRCDCAPNAALAIQVLTALEDESTQGISLILGFLHLQYTGDTNKALEHFFKAAKWHCNSQENCGKAEGANPAYRFIAARKIIQIIGPYATSEELKPWPERAREIRREVKLLRCSQYDKAGDEFFAKGDLHGARISWERALVECGDYLDKAGKAAIKVKLAHIGVSYGELD